jgi:hypothetical protein
VQLATALVAGEELAAQDVPLPVFIASDRDLLSAAGAEGLLVDDPLSHGLSPNR